MVQRVRETLIALKDAADNQSPFYPQTIHDKLEELIMVLVKEENHLQRDYSAGHDTAVAFWFEHNPGLMSDVVDLANQTSELIRKHLERVSVYPQ